jgi:dethiobiotin synthase
VKKFFITATGTDIGKTLVTAGISSAACRNNLKTAVMKPVQTGTAEYPGDLDVIRDMVPELYPLTPQLSCPYSFARAASPHLAAKLENTAINPEIILDAYNSIIEQAPIDLLLAEGAGGLMVPIVNDYTMLSLIKDMDIPVILVIGCGLGTINHSLLSIEAMRRQDIEITGIIANLMPESPGDIEKDNLETITRLGKVKILGTIPELATENLKHPELGIIFESIFNKILKK